MEIIILFAIVGLPLIIWGFVASYKDNHKEHEGKTVQSV